MSTLEGGSSPPTPLTGRSAVNAVFTTTNLLGWCLLWFYGRCSCHYPLLEVGPRRLHPIMITVTRRIQFCAGHRVYKHESKCSNLHGHNYVLWVTAKADRLDNLGRIVDFSVLKEMVGRWIDTYWDHGFLYFHEDIECRTLFACDERFLHTRSFRCTFNPTAEEMALYLLNEVCPDLFRGSPFNLKVVAIKLDETENCSATVTKQ